VFAGTAGDILKNEDLIAQNLGVVHGHETKQEVNDQSTL
jgi:hypothetical protein